MTTDFDRETDEKCEVIRINWINPEVDLGFDPGLLLNRIWIQSKNPKSVEAKNLVWTRLNELNRVNPLKKLYFEADIACSIAKQDLRRLALLTFVSRDSIVDQSWFLTKNNFDVIESHLRLANVAIANYCKVASDRLTHYADVEKKPDMQYLLKQYARGSNMEIKPCVMKATSAVELLSNSLFADEKRIFSTFFNKDTKDFQAMRDRSISDQGRAQPVSLDDRDVSSGALFDAIPALKARSLVFQKVLINFEKQGVVLDTAARGLYRLFFLDDEPSTLMALTEHKNWPFLVSIFNQPTKFFTAKTFSQFLLNLGEGLGCLKSKDEVLEHIIKSLVKTFPDVFKGERLTKVI